MGWAHDGAVTSSTVSTATVTRVGGELESVTASCVAAVPGPTAAVPGLGCEVPEPGATTAVPGLFVEAPAPLVGFLQSDPTASGEGGMKIESDSGDGLMDGLRRR